MSNETYVHSRKQEETLMAAKRRKGRTPRQVRLMEMVSKVSTLDFFRKMLDDETEAKLWRMFITGKAPKLGPDNKPILDPAGQFIMEDIELNPVSLKAFMRAVEYKRGMPIAVVKEESQGTDRIQVTVIGATPEFFEEQAKNRGLLVSGKGA